MLADHSQALVTRLTYYSEHHTIIALPNCEYCVYCEICKWQDRQCWQGIGRLMMPLLRRGSLKEGALKLSISEFQKILNTDNAYTHDRGKSGPLWSSCMEKFDAGAAE